MNSQLDQLPFLMLQRLDLVWTLFLLMARFLAFFMVTPGIGAGAQGVPIRTPAIIMFSFAALQTSKTTPVPEDVIMLALQVISELILGSFIGLVPLLVVSGAQAAGHIASGTMGLNGSQLFDPSTNVQVTDLARFYGDLTVAIFLLTGGHYAAIYFASTMGELVTPGTFLLTEQTIGLLVMRSARVFEMGIMIASPIIVALLLTNFVMGMITKVVSTVNIFSISFPILAGIGMILIILSLPEVFYFVQREFTGLDGAWMVIRPQQNGAAIK